MKEQEVWKPVVGYEEFYEVSNSGKVRGIERVIVLPTHSYIKKQKELKQFHDGRKYMHVKLYDGNANPRSLTVHRLVATAFIPNTNNLPEVNHKDLNKNNNNKDNLEWCTRGDNIRHIYESGRRDPSTYKGSGNKNSKLKEEQVIAIRKEYQEGNISYKQLAEKHKVGTTLIGYIINRNTWKHV
jgi:NUMOD4 motif/HNH endonuclease